MKWKIKDITRQECRLMAEGNEEVAPTYMGSDGQEHPRVYNRATQMWYNPEWLDDFRNSQGFRNIYQ